ncbi:hypothetical protein HanRHA438_Chr13g0590151 [Helianthus annuus]|nr:hypothetical protein HanPSC8_Chr13g0557521 [Helianthus annuus]KAJ0857438.1 hypothetical protein HanRHA438_Chr13g0590151 [Helianthus annuus]
MLSLYVCVCIYILIKNNDSSRADLLLLLGSFINRTKPENSLFTVEPQIK